MIIIIIFISIIFQPKIASMLLEKLPEFTEDDDKYVIFNLQLHNHVFYFD